LISGVVELGWDADKTGFSSFYILGKENLGVFKNRFLRENECPSPDSSGNPYVPAFGT
jgi:hypothetical protein